MYFKVLFFVFYVLTYVKSESEITFKNVTIWKGAEEKLATDVTFSSLEDILPRNNSLEVLFIKGEIPVLYKNSVANIANVEHLYFYENQIVEVQPEAFKNLSIGYLIVIRSNLTIIKKGIFFNVKLHTLEIKHNLIAKIENDAFEQVSKLKTLILSDNRLENLDKDMFGLLVDLENLDLSENGISILPQDILKHLPQLKMLSLKKNKLQQFPNIFEHSSLDTLDLSQNLISELSEGALDNLPQLSRLFLSFNNLDSIPSKVFSNHQNLQMFDLSNNKISSIAPDAFDNMPLLVNIKLTTNKISKYDINWFYKTPNLYRVDFANNLIEDLPDQAFKNIYNKKHQWISLNGNKIKTITPNTFKGIKFFDTLNLSDNKLEHWDANLLADVEEIYYLNLVHNNIKCVEGDFNQVFKANFTYLGESSLSPQCVQKIAEWRGTEYDKTLSYRTCTQPCIFYY